MMIGNFKDASGYVTKNIKGVRKIKYDGVGKIKIEMLGPIKHVLPYKYARNNWLKIYSQVYIKRIYDTEYTNYV